MHSNFSKFKKFHLLVLIGIVSLSVYQQVNADNWYW